MSSIESVERIIPAGASAIFALIADPSRHHEIDGSGTVHDATNITGPLTLGSTFGMDMKAGLRYSMVNTVVEFEQDRRIAWKPASSIPLLSKVLGGPIWRYVLEPVGTGTRVTESWDLSQSNIRLALIPLRSRTIAAMNKTLERIEAIVTTE